MRRQKRRKIRWIFCLLLAGLLMLGGCGKEAAEENWSENTEEKEKEPAAEESRSEKEKKPTEKESVKLLQAAPYFEKEGLHRELWAQDKKTVLAEGRFERVRVSGEGYEKAAEAVAAWSDAQEQEFLQAMKELEENAQWDLDQWDEEQMGEFFGYSLDEYMGSTRADSHVISIRSGYNSYEGGVHGYYAETGVTFDAKTGDRLSLRDLASDPQQFLNRAAGYCWQQLQAEYGEDLFGNAKDIVAESWENPEQLSWYLDAQGIVVVYNLYEVGPYAMGMAEVTLPYEEFSQWLKPEYALFDGSGAAWFPFGQEVFLPLGSQGEMTRVQLTVQEENPQELPQVYVEVGETRELAATAERIVSAYVLRRTDGRIYLLFDADFASDDYEIFIYEITDGRVRKAAETEMNRSIRTGSVNPDSLEVRARVDVLGTYSVIEEYQITEDGRLELQNHSYRREWLDPWGILVTTRPLPVTVKGKEAVLPAGSRLRIVGTDNAGIAYYQLIGSQVEGEIHYTREDPSLPYGTILIDGMEEWDCFKGLPYAG